jgi:hypothetical protein
MFALASDPERELPGALSFRTHRGWRLDVQGRLTPEGVVGDFGPVIGTTSGAEEITLVDVHLLNERVHSGAADDARYEQEFRAIVGFSGAKLPQEHQRTFRSGSFSFSQLVAWTDEPIRARHATDEEAFTVHEVEPREADVDGAKVGLFVGSSRLEGHTEFRVRRVASFYVSDAPAYRWSQWMGEFINPLNALLDIATVTPSTVETIAFDLPPLAGAEGDRPPDSVRVLFDAVRQPARDHRDQLSHRMLFNAKELPGGFEGFIPRWFDVYRRYREVLILGIASAYDRIGFLDNQFLNLTAAAEIYHRIANPDDWLIEPSEYQRRVDEVLGQYQGEMRRWIKGQFRGGNRPYLERRLTDVLRSAQREVQFRGDAAAIAKRIADTRNYLTHRDEARLEDAAGSEGQVRLMQVVWYCLVAELLKKAGFDSDFLRDRFGRDGRCRFIRQLDLLDIREREGV